VYKFLQGDIFGNFVKIHEILILTKFWKALISKNKSSKDSETEVIEVLVKKCSLYNNGFLKQEFFKSPIFSPHLNF